MKRKILSLLALLCLTVSSAWADSYFYLELSSTSATLMYGDPDTNPYFKSGTWYREGSVEYDGYSDLTTLTVDESCRNFKESEPDTGLNGLFYFWKSLTTINNIENLITSNVTSMNYMFYYCSALTTLDLSGCNTENVKYMEYKTINLSRTAAPSSLWTAPPSFSLSSTFKT